MALFAGRWPLSGGREIAVCVNGNIKIMDSMRLFNDPSIRRRLHGLVGRLAGNTALQQDMMQEALLHLWQLEEKRPGQSQAWYLQGCRLHLQNYLRLGRSVDSGKHFAAGMPEVVDGDDSHGSEGQSDQLEANEEFWGQIHAHDLISVLSPWLTAVEKKVLNCLADGLSARETAKRLNLSHAWVNKQRGQIASLAVKLGIHPPGKR